MNNPEKRQKVEEENAAPVANAGYISTTLRQHLKTQPQNGVERPKVVPLVVEQAKELPKEEGEL